MSVATYPNISISSTNFTLLAEHNGQTLVSTLAAGNVIAQSALPSGFNCWIITMGTGASTVTAGSGATVNGLSGTVVTGGQYGALQIIAVADGNFVVTAVS